MFQEPMRQFCDPSRELPLPIILFPEPLTALILPSILLRSPLIQFSSPATTFLLPYCITLLLPFIKLPQPCILFQLPEITPFPLPIIRFFVPCSTIFWLPLMPLMLPNTLFWLPMSRFQLPAILLESPFTWFCTPIMVFWLPLSTRLRQPATRLLLPLRLLYMPKMAFLLPDTQFVLACPRAGILLYCDSRLLIYEYMLPSRFCTRLPIGGLIYEGSQLPLRAKEGGQLGKLRQGGRAIKVAVVQYSSARVFRRILEFIDPRNGRIYRKSDRIIGQMFELKRQQSAQDGQCLEGELLLNDVVVADHNIRLALDCVRTAFDTINITSYFIGVTLHQIRVASYGV